MRAKKQRKPTIAETRAIRLIALSALMKTRTIKGVEWSTTTGVAVSNKIAEALIQNEWVRPMRDGLPMFDETQTYVVLKP